MSRFRTLRVTFDDAFRSIASVIPALEDRELEITIFVCTGFARAGAPLTIPELATEDPRQLATMTWEELRELNSRGIAVGSHTVSHAHLPLLLDGEIRRELSESKEAIESELSSPCLELAYPYGEHDVRVRSLARQAGYGRAFGLRGRHGDPFSLPRLDLYRRHTPARAMVLAGRLVVSSRDGRAA